MRFEKRAIGDVRVSVRASRDGFARGAIFTFGTKMGARGEIEAVPRPLYFQTRPSFESEM